MRKTYYLDKETDEMLNDLSLATGFSKSLILRKIVKYIYENGLIKEALIGGIKEKKREEKKKEERKNEKTFRIKL